MDKQDTGSKETRLIELSHDELDSVAGGSGKSGGNASGHIYLKFQFKLVAVKTISWS
jgi:hypothetical protein